MARVLLGIALAVQAAGVALAAFGELRRRASLASAGAAVLAIAWVLELAAVATFVALGAIPLRNGPEYLLTLGFLVLTIHLVLWLRSRISAAALVLPPISLLMLLAGFALQAAARDDVRAVPTRGWFVFHTVIATAGVAALAVAFAMSLLFLVKERALKEKRSLSVLERLPALEALDHLGFKALLFGFPLLTLGIATGMVYSAAVHDRIWIWGMKEIFPLMAWVVFAVILWARFAQGVRGRRSAILVIAGFALALLTFFGMVR